MEKELENTLDWREIGQRFKEVRERHNYKRSMIMEKTDDQGGAVYKYEAGAQPASTNYALFLRNTFGASFDWLYDGVENLRSERDRTEKKIFNPRAIGARLKAIRLKMGLTQKEFGLLIGLSSVGVGNIENGHRTPEIKTALKIKRALGKPLDWIYFGDEPIIPKKNRLQAKQSKSNQIKSNQSSPKAKKKSRL
ncbi:hypothetical protein CKC_00960 [Candidatus Liberibacter solanacearum CLso-ZC1]|uniref:HTH cro/C1-type domain-containing protein n=1 Tax=Liberibacter solanacearum (strain CLso-ZC1) TaxID=658172 RepID=E4UC53_LIBSC|nr:helix-turn-helix transcriptional regulator [Candidatus Liberibacter solanacearum]ADR51943.1 hypothetical protein CKC_00960 [Candidatus Liberibacter solanacearum CLso-ZC1]